MAGTYARYFNNGPGGGGGGGGGPLTVGPIDGVAPSANGLSIVGSVLYAQSASATFPGLVNNTAQTFSGDKTMTGSLTVSDIYGSSAPLGTLNLHSTHDATKGMIQALDGSSFFIESDPTNTIVGAFGAGWQSPFVFGSSTTQNTDLSFANLFANAGGSTARGVTVSYASSRGTYAAPSFPLSGDTLVTGVHYGYNGTSFAGQTTGTWALRATQNHSAVALGTKWEFSNILDGTITRLVSLNLENANVRLMGTANANLLWNTDGSGSIGASGANRPLNLFLSGSIQFGGVVLAATGSATSPSYSFTGDGNTGMYRVAADSLGFATNGVLRANFDSTGNFLMGVGQLEANDGTAAAPGITFNGDSDTGIFRASGNTMGFAAGGTAIANLDINSLRTRDGVVTDPYYSFLLDSDTGMWRSGANVLDFSTGATDRLQIGSAGSISLMSASAANLLWNTNGAGNIGSGSNDPLNIFYSLADMKQIATPSNPAAGRDRLYFKSDDFLYTLSPGGTERRITPNTIVTVVTVSGTTTLVAADSLKYLNVDVSGGAATINLPAPSSGLIYRIKDSKGNSSTNNITVNPNGAEKIEGLAVAKIFQSDWGFWTIYSDGTDWFIG